MMTISLCMIVKNEEKVLARCLESIKNIVDEIIIVDTGSTDKTKDIAKTYTDKIYDFEWIDDFSAARNFAFSKASCDYIYSADADEYLDEKNQREFYLLKQALIPEVEIVQMVYITKAKNHPTENFERDYRPKLYKRLRTFTWIDPIHEIVNVNPIVFDSEVEIIHEPEESHAKRDFNVFVKTIREKGFISERLLGMYLRELYKAGDLQNLIDAKNYLSDFLESNAGTEKTEICRKVIAVLLKCYRLEKDDKNFLKMTLEVEANIPSAEICLEIGKYFSEHEDYNEAVKWFYEAANNAESDLDINSSGEEAQRELSKAYSRFATK